MTEKVSVIVPVYNVEKYLRQCLDSILQQTYQNLEILIINDGSTDGSDAICREYLEKDERITYHIKENSGVFLEKRRIQSGIFTVPISLH